MHQEYVYVLTLIRAISYMQAFVPAEESLGCFLTHTHTLLADFQLWGNETKRA